MFLLRRKLWLVVSISMALTSLYLFLSNPAAIVIMTTDKNSIILETKIRTHSAVLYGKKTNKDNNLSATGQQKDLSQHRQGNSRQSSKTPNDSVATAEKWAYAFYAPNEAYLCYALVNADRLLNTLKIQKNIDIVFIVNNYSGVQKVCTTECVPDGRLKLYYTPEIGDAYEKAFGRFEAFGMTDYTKIALVDADGLVMRNMDGVFGIDLEGRNMATTISRTNGTEILTTAVMVIQPSQSLLERVSKFQSPEAVSRISEEVQNLEAFSYSSDADLLLNRMSEEKLFSVTRLPINFTAIESSFAINDKKILDTPYFVSFDNRPLEVPDGGRSIDENNLQEILKASAGTERVNPMNIFWQLYYKRCDGLNEQQENI